MRSVVLGLVCLVVLCVNVYAVENMVVNPDFDEPLEIGWNLEVHGDHVVATMELDSTTSVEGKNSARIDIESIVEGAEVWRLQLKQFNIVVKGGETYTWSFWAKTDDRREAAVQVCMEVDPWAVLGVSENIELESEWQEYHFTFDALEDFDNTRLAMQLAGSPETVWLDHVRFYEGDYVSDPDAGAAAEPMGKMASTWGTIKASVR